MSISVNYLVFAYIFNYLVFLEFVLVLHVFVCLVSSYGSQVGTYYIPYYFRFIKMQLRRSCGRVRFLVLNQFWVNFKILKLSQIGFTSCNGTVISTHLLITLFWTTTQADTSFQNQTTTPEHQQPTADTNTHNHDNAEVRRVPETCKTSLIPPRKTFENIFRRENITLVTLFHVISYSSLVPPGGLRVNCSNMTLPQTLLCHRDYNY